MNNSYQNNIVINDLNINNSKKIVLIAGPCALESEDHAFEMAGKIKEICNKVNIEFIYKSSFDKANRSSMNGKRGIGIDRALKIFEKLKKDLIINIVTDVHINEHCKIVSEVVDIIQIPAFLCRQTDLIVAAAETGKAVMVKKGQFLSPREMKNIVDKLEYSGCKKILLCERGTSFGYNNLVSDFRALPIMKEFGFPVIFDATHSVQEPGGLGKSSGGNREYVPVLAKASVAVGVAGVFIETHNDPDNAPSDGPNMLNISDLEILLEKLLKIDSIVKE